jgi:hypothetical protein
VAAHAPAVLAALDALRCADEPPAAAPTSFAARLPQLLAPAAPARARAA